MFKDDYQAVCNGGAAKNRLLKNNPLGYMASAIIAGMFISFGSFVSMALGYYVSSGGFQSGVKLIQAISFASALSLVVMAGAELFTGNNFVMAAASIRKVVSWADTIKLWIVCWIGNLIGSVFCVAVFQMTGVPTGSDAAIAQYFIGAAQTKVALGPVELITRAVFCNALVCLAVWCATKMKSESGKLIMIFWCILIFMVNGFEHSIANMSIIGVAVANGGVTVGQYCYNILLATVGNIIGGVVLVAIPYHLISKEK